MGDSEGVIRVNVSVPREVKARMDAAGKSVNWSAVATEAFRAKLLDLDSRREATGMDEVIARLKAAEEVDSKEEYQDGAEAGRSWARALARPKHLRALAALADSQEGAAGSIGVWTNGANRGVGCGLFQAINPRGDAHWSTVQDFWEEALGGDPAARIEEEGFAQGFIDGALEVWDAAKKSL